MTIEQKAKAYDEALKDIKVIYPDLKGDVKFVVEQAFPELKESEDERIRKELLQFIKDFSKHHWRSVDFSRWIAWLENQKEAKDFGELMNKLTAKEQNGEDKEDNDFTIYHPLKNGKGEYECIPYSFYGSLTSFSEDKDLIDFLRTCFYTKEECNEWIKQQKEPENVSATTMIPSCWAEEPSLQEEQKPVKFNDDTEVGLDRALQIVKKAKGNLCGYQSDDGIYECDHAIQTLEHILKNGIEQKPAECIEDSVKFEEGFKAGRESGLCDGQKYVLDNFDSYGLCKPAEWSEEDERNYEYLHQIICNYINNPQIEYKEREKASKELIPFWERLKSLRPQPKQEWSEEDDQLIRFIFDLLNDMFWRKDWVMSKEECLERLKSLRPQPHWKPSEEQMRALWDLMHYAVNLSSWDKLESQIESLYNDIKKL